MSERDNQEEHLKRELIRYIANYFVILEEVAGTNLVDNCDVRIDLLLYPKQILIDNGFDPGWFGVEVKHLDFSSEKKMNRLVWQAITYAQSEFELNGGKARPMFVLMYSGDDSVLQDARWRTLVHFAQYANVGRIITHARLGWSILFSTLPYYSQRNGKGNVSNIGMKRYAGTVR